MTRLQGSTRDRNRSTIALAALTAAAGLVVAACVAVAPSGSAGPAARSPAAAASSPAAGETTGSAPSSGSLAATASASATGAAAQMPVPSGPSSATLESTAPASPHPAGAASGSGGRMGSYLIVCLGPGGGGPCVPAADGRYVIAAETALPGPARDTVTAATFTPGTCASAGVPCAAGETGAGIVAFTFTGGTERVFVLRRADGTLSAVPLH